MEFPIKEPIIALVGPTAIGKTELSLSLAEAFNCEIVSLDSMQVYRYMDVGTAKATADERKRVAHHLIDIVNPDESYNANRYVDDALRSIQAIHQRSKTTLITGGTGLYLRSLIDGLFQGVGDFPEIRQKLHEDLQKKGASKLHEELFLIDRISANKIHTNDTHRIIRALEIYHATGKSWSDHIASQSKERHQRFSNVTVLGLTCDRNVLYQRINKRTKKMIKDGLEREVRHLLSQGYHRNLQSMQSIGYRHMVGHLIDEWPSEKMIELLARDTRRYAKRQYTWFKKMNVEWLEVSDKDKIVNKIGHFIDLHKT